MMHDSNLVANRFLELASEHGDTLTPMQILKLVYIGHGWMLGMYGVPLIVDDVQAWKFGPVIPRLYNAVKDFRDNPVRGPLPVRDCPLLIDIETDLISQVYDQYGSMTGPSLSRLTHQAGTPWALTYREGVNGLVISNDLIEEHYNQLAMEAA
jgi:uncharacterized phage-associated protein